jgi:hypothetical protein
MVDRAQGMPIPPPIRSLLGSDMETSWLHGNIIGEEEAIFFVYHD